MPSSRNQHGLTELEIARCLGVWEVLDGPRYCPLDTTLATQHGSRTRYNEEQRKVYLGADVHPGTAVDARSRMSATACLTHECSHADRHLRGYGRPLAEPDSLLDEAEASLNASFYLPLSARDREDLVEDARDRVSDWLGRWQRRNQDES